MEAFLVATGMVALAEMGDKTQLLALVLAARFRKPWPIVLGIFAATILNHALAGAVGNWVTHWLGADDRCAGSWAASFIAMALWMLIPDKLDDERRAGKRSHFGVFGTTRASPSSWPRWATRPRSPPSCWRRAYVDAYVWVVVAGTTLRHDAGQRAGGLPRRTHREARADQARARHLGRDLPGARRGRRSIGWGAGTAILLPRADLLQLAGA